MVYLINIFENNNLKILLIMKKILIGIIFTVICLHSFSQSPQSFQYQTVVRDVAGTALVNQPVNFQISILSGSITGTVVYSETHTSSTNAYGIVTLNVGSGTPVSGTFSAINWGSTSHYIKVEADPTGGTSYLDMGTTQLLSVPYALYSGQAGNIPVYSGGTGIDVTGTTITNTAPDQAVTLTQGGSTTVSGTYPNFTVSSTDLNTGTPGGLNKTVQFNNSGSFDGDTALIWDNTNKRLGLGFTNPSARMMIQGSPSAPDSVPLFEIKNKLGQQVMVIYNDSIQFFITDAASNRGGFAVSGRNNAKAFTNNYLVVNPDSTRIYLNEDINNNGFAVKGINAGGIKDYLNVSVDTTEIINPSQSRILWYPTKEAFLTGKVLIEDKDSVGVNSFASGYESKAVGDWSQALGYKPVTRGNYAVSIGKTTQANGINSFAFGDSAIARSSGSFSIGYKSEAAGIGSFAFGTSEINEFGIQTGNYTKAEGDYSFALGLGAKTTPSGFGSISMGMGSSSENYGAAAFGVLTKATGKLSSSVGYNSLSSGDFSISLGISDTSSGTNSFSMGVLSKSIGNSSMAIGNNAVASGMLSASIGFSTVASGDNSMALGRFVSTNNNNGSIIIGDASTILTTNSTNVNQFMVRASGGYVYYSDPLLLEINTMYLSPLTGRLGVGWSNPQAKVDINGSLRVNSGTTFNKIEGGTSVIGTNVLGGVKVSSFVFPTPFTGIPKITVTAKGGNFNDVFVVTTRNVNNVGFQVNVYRVDNAGGTWSQNLEIDWFAWE